MGQFKKTNENYHIIQDKYVYKRRWIGIPKMFLSMFIW